MTRSPDAPQLPIDSVDQWQAWLAEHYDDPDPGVWLVWDRTKHGGGLPYEPFIEVTLAYGWIDSQASTLDEDRTMLWVTRRRPGSVWSRLSKERVARVIESGRMTEAGQAAIDRAKADGSWTILDSVEAMEVPNDLAEALADDPLARTHFEGFTPGRRKQILRWLATAKRPDTRARRVAETIRLAAQGVAAGGR